MPSRTSSSINHIAVVGSGLMGTGIAQIGLEAGIHVVLVGRSEEKCQKAVATIRMGVTRATKKRIPDNQEALTEKVNNLMSLLTTTTSLEQGVSNAEVVLEAVIENLKVKQNLLEEIEQFARK
uniref:3-hydroxyacyl-CoA dehydrogenase NAD binding domain-containing protein n=1 Tax=Plectus sambesii TaxID=2011161 RepID=A0A914UZQ4_9BILA